MQDHVLLHLPAFAVELKKKNLDHEACIFSFSLYQDVFSCANICIVTHSLPHESIIFNPWRTFASDHKGLTAVGIDQPSYTTRKPD